MEGKLKKLKKDDTVGVYRFRDNDFIVGDILKISDNYLFLNSIDVNGQNNGIKVILLDIIERIVLNSDYIEELKKKSKTAGHIKINKNISAENFYNIIIEDKILVLTELEDGSTETGYIIKKEKENLYFNFVDDTYKITSREIIKERYIKKIKILEEIKFETEKDEKIKKIRMNTGTIYFGYIKEKSKDYLIFQEKPEFNDESSISIVKAEKTEEITEILETVEFQKIEIKNKITEIGFSELLKASMENQLLVFIDNEDYEETKVGMVIELSEKKFRLKEFSQYRKFSEISTIKYSEVQLLYIYNYKIGDK
jgi:hypothetical protein